MSIFINKQTRLLVQGITGRDGTFHAQSMREYGTNVVGGVTPGKGGQKVGEIPVFDSVFEARKATGANASMIFVPAAFAVDAIYEAVDAGIELVVCISEGVPTLDMVKLIAYIRMRNAEYATTKVPRYQEPEEFTTKDTKDTKNPEFGGFTTKDTKNPEFGGFTTKAPRHQESGELTTKNQEPGTRLLGPNCPGLISPGESKVGIMPSLPFRPGHVGVVSRSGTLTYEIAAQITSAGHGQSTVVGIGGDPIIGTNFIDCLSAFNADPATEAIVIVGEIGGSDEEEAAKYIRANIRKPVFGFIAGQTAPADKRMGHAGAIISAGSGLAADKIKAFQAAGIEMCFEPAEVASRVRARLGVGSVR